MRILWLPDALRAEGLKVVVQKGWRTRGFEMTGPLEGVMFHHTVTPLSSPDSTPLRTVTFGRTDLPGPIAQVMVGRDGTAYVIASGRANHAGEGGPWRNVPANNGGNRIVGVEVVNNGTTEEWTETVLGACDRVFAAVLKKLGKDASWCLGHKEWAPGRKVDPHTLNMDRYRERLQAYMDGNGGDAMFEKWKAGWDAHEAGREVDPEWPAEKKNGWRDRNVLLRDAKQAAAELDAANGGGGGGGAHSHTITLSGSTESAG